MSFAFTTIKTYEHVKRNCHTSSFVDLLSSFMHLFLTFLRELNYSPWNSFLETAINCFSNRGFDIASIDSRSFHFELRLLLHGLAMNLNDEIFAIVLQAISLKSESICLIAGYVMVLFGFRFVLFVAFNALHQPRIPAQEKKEKNKKIFILPWYTLYTKSKS